MVKRLSLRALTDEEVAGLRKLLRKRTAPRRLVDRARIVWWMHEGWWAGDIVKYRRVSLPTVRLWITRFNAEGLDGLRDRPRSGRPATYTPEQTGEVVAVALTAPRTLGLPFACWTLDRLQAYLHDERDLPIKRSRIDELLRGEGLRWRQQETWFGERVDPAFAEKRGPSSPCTRPHQKAAS